MQLNRRRFLKLGGTSLSIMTLGGCLSNDPPDSGPNGTDSTETNDSDGSDPSESPNNRSPEIDKPPYEITEPACDDNDERDPLWLCASMPAEPSVDFEQIETSTLVFADEGLRIREKDDASEYYATFLTEASNLNRLHDEASNDVVAFVEGTEFDTEAVLVAQTGWGSGAKTPHLKRIENTSNGIHAFGCLRQPCVWTDDFTVRTVLARFQRPTSLDGSQVSVTIDAETRVTFGVSDW